MEMMRAREKGRKLSRNGVVGPVHAAASALPADPGDEMALDQAP
jgi:hypothetical protein